MSVQDNIRKIEKLKKEISSHCMCGDFQSDKYQYMVLYPYGFKVDGVQCAKRIGKAEALERILKHMKEEWEDSLWWQK